MVYDPKRNRWLDKRIYRKGIKKFLKVEKGININKNIDIVTKATDLKTIYLKKKPLRSACRNMCQTNFDIC